MNIENFTTVTGDPWWGLTNGWPKSWHLCDVGYPISQHHAIFNGRNQTTHGSRFGFGINMDGRGTSDDSEKKCKKKKIQ